MTLYILLPLSLLAFLVFHYVITPRVKRSKSNSRWVAKVGKPGLLAILKYVYTFFFIATLTYALLVIVTLVAGLSGANSSAGFESAIKRIQGYRESLKVFKSFWTVALFAFIFVAVTLILYRRLKRAVSAEVEEEKERLKREREAGGVWDSLEPSAEMNEVAKKIFTAQVLFDRLDTSAAPQGREVEDARRELKAKIQSLRAEWYDLDLERRAYRNVEAQAARPNMSAPRGSKARRFFGSKGFLDALQRTSRGMGHAALVLLFLSLVGVNTPLVDGALARRIVRLSDLQVKANQQEARESFAKLLGEEEDGGQNEIKEEDEKTLRGLSRHFEQAFTSSHVWHPTYVYHGSAAQIRKDLVRDKIVNIRWQSPPDGPDSPKGGPDDKGPGPSSPEHGPGGDRSPHGPTPSSEPSGGQPRMGTERPRSGGDVGPTKRDAPFSSDDIRARLGSDEWPQTEVGERFSADVRLGIIGKSKKFWGRIKANLAAYADKFGEPFETLEFGKWAVGEAVGATVDSVWHHMPEMGEIKEPAKGTIKAGLKDAAKKLYESFSGGEDLKEVAQRVYDLSFEQFMTDLRGGMPLDEALGRVEAGVAGQPVASADEIMKLRVVSEELLSSEAFRTLEQSLKNNPPTVPEPADDVTKAKVAAQQLEKTLNAEGRTSLRPEEYEKLFASTDTYEDHYPGSPEASAKTARQTLLAKTSERPAPEVFAERSAQSRDFSQLKLSTDVGGVLIGRAPDKVTGDADFRDLSWTVSGAEVTLRLKRADGGEVTLGPFRKDIVNDALVYVADDRKVVVTIQTSFSDDAKVWKKRILLHPALVDTALGNDVIEFDGLVFKLTKGDPRRKASEQPIESQQWLYDLAWYNRQLALYELLLERRLDERAVRWAKGGVARSSRVIKFLLENRRTAAAIQFGLRDSQKEAAPDNALLRKYPGYFDPELVRAMNTCVARSYDSGDIFGRCVQGEVRGRGISSAPEETLLKWLAQPVDTAPRSIAEERPFVVDAGLNFLRPEESAQTAAQLWPFEFRYEIAFPANAPFLNELEKKGDYRTPWEYSELRGLIAEKVAGGVGGDANTRDLFRRVRDFTVLQRLFRVSLDGGLGNQFPIEKLVGLTRATAERDRGRETPRWEVERISED